MKKFILLPGLALLTVGLTSCKNQDELYRKHLLASAWSSPAGKYHFKADGYFRLELPLSSGMRDLLKSSALPVPAMARSGKWKISGGKLYIFRNKKQGWIGYRIESIDSRKAHMLNPSGKLETWLPPQHKKNTQNKFIEIPKE